MAVFLRDTEYDDFTGITTKYWIDKSNGDLTIERIEDVESILQHNKQLQAENHNKSFINDSSWGHKVADIPNIVIEQWLKEGIDLFSTDPDMKKKVLRKLQDPSYRYLRTMNTRLI